MSEVAIKKIFSLLSVVRGYNIVVLVATLYLAAIFIFSGDNSAKTTLLDLHLHYVILANICVIAGGYIVNNFYDVQIDRINRPIKHGLDNYIKQETKLSIYFILNFLGFSFGWLISWRAALFFSCYIFGIWFYSHKLKKLPFLGLLSVTILTILPFFSLFVYYKNFSKIIFIHAFFLFFIIMAREIVKELENLKGAIVSNYKTFPVVYGEKKSKQLFIFLLILTAIPVAIIYRYSAFRYMKYYFYLAGVVLVFSGIYIMKAYTKNQYRLLHNILKILLLIGSFSLLFIDRTLILEKVVTVFN